MATEKTSTLPSLPELLQQIQLDIGDNVELFIIMAFMAAMLTIHGVAVLVIASAFHRIGRFLNDDGRSAYSEARLSGAFCLNTNSNTLPLASVVRIRPGSQSRSRTSHRSTRRLNLVLGRSSNS